MSEIPFAVHNPALLPADVLLGEFTARRTLLTTLLRIVRGNARGKPQQHVVLVGARGMGKTTTLWAVSHSISNDVDLSREWQPVVFDEESRRIGDLADFWLEAIRQWELATHSADAQAERLLENAVEDLEEQARAAFLQALDRSGKRAVLLIDNLNDVFASISDAAALHRLRAFLMEDDRVMIVGAATRHFEAITGLDEPFFDFFRVFTLASLTLEEMQATLLTLAERRGETRVTETIEQRPGTIRSLHVLTGGNPRLIKTFYRLLAEGLRGDVRQDLERLVDEFTPYFKAILDGLSTQQQRIIDAVALAWEPVEVATIARATRLPSNQVSAQLRILVKSNIATEAAGSSAKRKTYLLADRFSNIHYLMRHGRTARRRFDWFVLTLRALFPDPEQADALARVAGRTALAGVEGIRDTRDLLTSALLRAENEDSRRRIVQATIREVWDQETLANFDEWLDIELVKQHLPASASELDIVAFMGRLPTEARKRIGYKPDDVDWWYGVIGMLEEREAWILAEAGYRKAIELDARRAYLWNDFARLLFQKLNRPIESEVICRRAIEVDPAYATPWNGLGLVLIALGRPDEAEIAFRRAIELDSDNAFALWNLANFLTTQDRFSEADPILRRAVELRPEDSDVWNDLGILLHRSGRFDEAEKAYRRSLGLQRKSYTASNLGLMFQDLDRSEDARVAFNDAIELDPGNGTSYVGLAEIYAKMGAYEDARVFAIKGLLLRHGTSYARDAFVRIAGNDPSAWETVLPSAAASTAPDASSTNFDFVFNGFIRYAQLTSAAEAKKLLSTVADPSPFETLSDAFRAHTDPVHLHRLAPERQALVVEILDRIAKDPKLKRKKRARKRAST